jgi:hypothetical protein
VLLIVADINMIATTNINNINNTNHSQATGAVVDEVEEAGMEVGGDIGMRSNKIGEKLQRQLLDSQIVSCQKKPTNICIVCFLVCLFRLFSLATTTRLSPKINRRLNQ